MFTQNFVKILSETLSPFSSRHFFQAFRQSAYSLLPFDIVFKILSKLPLSSIYNDLYYLSKKEKRISEINGILKKVGIEVEFKYINEFQKDIKNDIEIACHILNIDDKGSLDNILKTIAKGKSEYADCLKAWKECLEDKGESVSDTIFTKFWVNNYLRFDTCTKKEQKQSSKKCNFEKALEKDTWDFEHKSLKSLKFFLKMF